MARAASTTHRPAASAGRRPPARAIAEATAPIPIAPLSSGTSRRERLRISKASSTVKNGTAAVNGTHHHRWAVSAATAIATNRTASSRPAMRSASADRASRRCRLRSTTASFSGVRARKAANAATPIATPPALGRTSSPSSTASKVRPHPPCSEGTATLRHNGRGPGAPRSAWTAAVGSITVPTPLGPVASELRRPPVGGSTAALDRVLGPAQRHAAPGAMRVLGDQPDHFDATQALGDPLGQPEMELAHRIGVRRRHVLERTAPEDEVELGAPGDPDRTKAAALHLGLQEIDRIGAGRRLARGAAAGALADLARADLGLQGLG